MADIKSVPHFHLTRRSFLSGFGAAAAAGATLGVARPALAVPTGQDTFPDKPAPKPIPQIVDTAAPGFTPPDPFRFIHWLLPGPPGSSTPVLTLPGFGLDVDPSTITDFDGFTAFAVVSGSATDSDGNQFDVEFDVRVMEGTYVGADGDQHHGTFGFF